ncbi:hypothetical protein [Microbacterium aurum]
MNMLPFPDRRSTYQPALDRVSLRSLVSAEFHRARQTRSTLTLVTIVVGVALVMLIVRTILASTSDTPIGPEAVTLSGDAVGFGVFLAIAVAVARDHQTGATDLLRTLTPARPRHLAARAIGTGILALIAIGVVIVAGLATVLLVSRNGMSWELADTIARTATTTFLLAGAGVGIGAATRSTAAATFAVIALYWLLPIGLTVAGLTGATWAGAASDATLGILVSNATMPSPDNWAAVGGIALWSLGLGALGLIRETKGN